MSCEREHTLEQIQQRYAVVVARWAAGLGTPRQSLDDPWWAQGPHMEIDGHCYFVHARGALTWQLAER
jgi:hypothetical protein